MHSPESARDQFVRTKDLAENNAPLLFVLRELSKRGWTTATKSNTAKNTKNTLTSPVASWWSDTQLKNRCLVYVQCLLIIADLFSTWLTEFVNTGAPAYYTALLHAEQPNAVD